MGMTLIEHAELDSPAGIITFSNIPDTFTDLKIIFSLRGPSAPGQEGVFLYMNEDTSWPSYSYQRYAGDGSTPFSNSGGLPGIAILQGNTTANTFCNGTATVLDYRSSVHKFVMTESVNEANVATEYVSLYGMKWLNNNPITSLSIGAQVSMETLSSATLYGITAGSDGITTVS